MGGQEEFMGASDLAHQMVKGRRRTKRLRSPSPYKAVASAGLSSGFGGRVGGGGSVGEEHHCSSISSPATSSEIDIDSTEEEEEEEEEDMANCLILLAQGEGPKPTVTETAEKFSARDFSGTVAAPTASRTGFYVNYCKTCKRSFQSFQALGGHRATHHRKPKATAVEQKKAPVALSMIDPDDDCQLNKSCSLDDPISHRLASNNNKIFRGKMAMKTHECSICGSQFTSGQALGGHMRRHRANAGNHMGAIIESVKTGEIKPRNILPLDLNLPAPENDDDHGPETDTNFQFASKQQALVFSAPALVDCHY